MPHINPLVQRGPIRWTDKQTYERISDKYILMQPAYFSTYSYLLSIRTPTCTWHLSTCPVYRAEAELTRPSWPEAEMTRIPPMSFLVSDVTGTVYSNGIPRFVNLVHVYWLVGPRDWWHCFHSGINAYQRWIQRLDQSSCDKSDSGTWIIFYDQELCIFRVCVNKCCLYYKDGRICFKEVRFHLYLAAIFTFW